jgi:hypothetical protein
MKTSLTPMLLAAALLSGCAATVPVAPATPPAEDDQSRAVHGSTLPISLNVDTSKVDPNLVNVKVNCGVACSGGTSTPVAPAPTPATLAFVGDSMQIDSQGFWNTIATDPNPNSNADYGKDAHLELTLPSDLASTTLTKVSMQNTTTGGHWDSVGYPNHQYLAVYASDGATQLLKGGSSAPIAAGQKLELYMDTGNPDTPNNALHAGDLIIIQLETAAGARSFSGLKL